MDLHTYYRKNKDEINSSIMEIASDLAAARLMNEHQVPFENFVEPDDPDDPDGGTHYKEEYQDEYNKYYDDEYDRITRLMRFDIGEEDGVRKDDTPDAPLASLVSRANAWRREARVRIICGMKE